MKQMKEVQKEHDTSTKSTKANQSQQPTPQPASLWPAYPAYLNSDGLNQWAGFMFPPSVRNQLQQQWFESFFPLQAMDRLQKYWSAWGNLPRFTSGFVPSVDIIERDEEVLIRAEMAGMNKDYVDLSVTDNSITIESSVEHDDEKSAGNYHRQETMNGTYARTLSLPCPVVGSQAKAEYIDGLLEVTIPKQQVTKSQSVNVG